MLNHFKKIRGVASFLITTTLVMVAVGAMLVFNTAATSESPSNITIRYQFERGGNPVGGWVNLTSPQLDAAFATNVPLSVPCSVVFIDYAFVNINIRVELLDEGVVIADQTVLFLHNQSLPVNIQDNESNTFSLIFSLSHPSYTIESYNNTYHDYVCNSCGVVIERTTHNWEVYNVTTGNCGVERTATERCSDCGATRNVTMPALECIFDEHIVTEATCIAPGLKMLFCTRPGCTHDERVVIPALGHDWNVVGGMPPTCTTDGYAANRVCRRCNATEQNQVLPRLGHNWVDIVIPPTCTTEGVTIRRCDRPGCSEPEDRINRIPPSHNWDEGEIVVPATPEADGERVYTCLTCGSTRSETIAYVHPPAQREPSSIGAILTWIVAITVLLAISGGAVYFFVMRSKHVFTGSGKRPPSNPSRTGAPRQGPPRPPGAAPGSPPVGLGQRPPQSQAAPSARPASNVASTQARVNPATRPVVPPTTAAKAVNMADTTTSLSFADNGFDGDVFDKIMENDIPNAPADLDDLFLEKLLADAQKHIDPTPAPDDSSPVVFKDGTTIADFDYDDVSDVFE